MYELCLISLFRICVDGAKLLCNDKTPLGCAISKPEKLPCPITLLDIARRAAARYLPISHSLIPYDLLLQIYLRDLDESCEPHNIKSLFVSLPHSEMGMRYHLRRLIDGQWISLRTSDSDPRARLVIPTSKTRDRFADLSRELSEYLIKSLS